MSAGWLPDSVKIGAFNYRIERWDRKDADDAARFAEVSHPQLRIRIDPTYCDALTAESLLHEIFHCILRLWVISPEKSEEQVVSSLSRGLATVMRDNPRLFEVLVDRIQHGS